MKRVSRELAQLRKDTLSETMIESYLEAAAEMKTVRLRSLLAACYGILEGLEIEESYPDYLRNAIAQEVLR